MPSETPLNMEGKSIAVFVDRVVENSVTSRHVTFQVRKGFLDQMLPKYRHRPKLG